MKKAIYSLLVLILVSLTSPLIIQTYAAPSYSIEVQDFSWNTSSLNVLVDTNQWSTHDYVVAVREALDTWKKSIWTFTHSHINTSIMFDYVFFVRNVNSTNNYDIIVKFVQKEIDPTNKIVGRTQVIWDETTHIPNPPFTITITTHSGKADRLFVKNVALHELGHALGLNHASVQWSSNGPELMNAALVTDSIVYPSTLDVYGLIMLSRGKYNQTIQLPTDIPYKMLIDNVSSHPFQILPLNPLSPSTIAFVLVISVSTAIVLTTIRRLRE